MDNNITQDPPMQAPLHLLEPTCLPCPLPGLTSAIPAVPFPDGLGHLLSDPDAVPMEPLVAVVTSTARDGASGRHVRGMPHRCSPTLLGITPPPSP